MDDEILYCLNVLLKVKGYECSVCGKLGTYECKKICNEVEKLICR